MLHIAQPENIHQWLDDGLQAGLMDFDILGLSYYAKWSSTPFANTRSVISGLVDKYNKDVVIVETAYPWTLEGNDEAGNLLGEDSLISGYPASIDGQRRYLIDLMQATLDGGGLGIVYWEPAWVSTKCNTRWGTGSHWENAALFEYADTELHDGAAFLSHSYLTHE